MGHGYDGKSIAELERLWKEKRDRLMALGASERSQKDMDELFILRREISKRKGDLPPTANVDYAKDYLTD